MQKSFVALKRVFLQPGNVVLNNGDILLFDPGNHNKLAIYRAQKLVTTTTHTMLGLQGLEKAGFIEGIDTPEREEDLPSTAIADEVEMAPVAKGKGKRTTADIPPEHGAVSQPEYTDGPETDPVDMTTPEDAPPPPPPPPPMSEEVAEAFASDQAESEIESAEKVLSKKGSKAKKQA